MPSTYVSMVLPATIALRPHVFYNVKLDYKEVTGRTPRAQRSAMSGPGTAYASCRSTDGDTRMRNVIRACGMYYAVLS